MKNLKDTRTKIIPSKTRGGKELPSSFAFDSPTVLNPLVTPPPIDRPDMSHELDDATCKINDNTTAIVDETEIVPLDELLDAHIAKARELKMLKLMKILNRLLHLDLLIDMSCLMYLKFMLWMGK